MQLFAVVLTVGLLVGAVWWRMPRTRPALVWVAVSARRVWWLARITGTWHATCRDANLSQYRTKQRRTRNSDGEWSTKSVQVWNHPKLRSIRASGHAVTIRVKARRGQTITDLEAGAERLAAAYGVQTFRCWPHPKRPASVLVVEFVMRELLAKPRTAGMPDPLVVFDAVRLGITQAGADWMLKVRGWHTLVVGASGSGKGSVLWNICCGLAPAVTADYVRLWGIDLKKGVELATGEALFHERAYTPEQAVELLRRLIEILDARGAEMIGKTRLHVPTAGSPIHVAVIDELANATAYADSQTRREFERLLSLILTQGRALGVVVVAFVQDPRKEVVGMRGLFTQTVALRLRTSDETSMVLGDGMARLAPAHRINPERQGTAWVVEDNGAVDRARADYWPDDAIRDVAALYGTSSKTDTEGVAA
jgi:S-DNA-T family DNA segregation ATPase FtsK/SpoIIIE